MATIPGTCPVCQGTDEWELTLGARTVKEVAAYQPRTGDVSLLPTRIVVCANCGCVFAKPEPRKGVDVVKTQEA